MAHRVSLLATLKARGFDESRVIPFERGATVRCSQCEALVICGVACHERGCPNMKKECKGCGALISSQYQWREYCQDCDN